jgi:hypothetical protein
MSRPIHFSQAPPCGQCRTVPHRSRTCARTPLAQIVRSRRVASDRVPRERFGGNPHERGPAMRDSINSADITGLIRVNPRCTAPFWPDLSALRGPVLSAHAAPGLALAPFSHETGPAARIHRARRRSFGGPNRPVGPPFSTEYRCMASLVDCERVRNVPALPVVLVLGSGNDPLCGFALFVSR